MADIVNTATKTVSKVSKFFGKYSSWFTWISIGIQVIGWLRKPDEPDIPHYDNVAEQMAKGVLINKASSNSAIPIVYGKRKIGGNITFLETSGTDNTYLYLVMALCEGGVESCEQIYIDDKLVTWSGTLTHGTERTVGSGDSNIYKDSESKISVLLLGMMVGTIKHIIQQ